MATRDDVLSCSMSKLKMNTTAGTIELELFDADAPKTVENFRKLAADGCRRQAGGSPVDRVDRTDRLDPGPRGPRRLMRPAVSAQPAAERNR